MRKIITLGLMAFAFVAGSLSLTAASAHDDDDGALELTAESNQYKQFDVGKKGLSLGDSYVFSDDVWMDGKRVGSLDGSCVVTRVKGTAHHEQCTVTVSLPNGQMTSQGAIAFDKNFHNKFTIAITGGTDDYAGVDGEAHVKFLSETKSTIEVDLD